MARARLRDRHQDNLRRKLELLKAEQGVEEEEGSEGEGAAEGTTLSADEAPEKPEEKEESEGSEVDEDQVANAMLTESFADYDSGQYSPRYLSQSQLEPGTLVTTEEDDAKRLVFARLQVQGTGKSVQPATSLEEEVLQREARKGMTNDEAEFSVESILDSQVYLWSDKYRPRKPRYFNRVHTGFEWNKYNQTHYDMDNPPPKIVQGYKFNIFYPDLIDKNATPEYFLTPCPENHDFAILRFHAGPPYEDIAFKIVNREWEYSYKRGFRCQFHNNIFQLWFHFKRYRYRR
ncbi:cactin [Homalodisca vitripennis]|nr:cactin [Homalodisca vitripennis]KAG8312614.1 hypothetical protein J6590_020537 [Homalodisca vitripennis]